MSKSPDDLIDAAEAAAMLGLAVRTVRQHAAAGHLTGRRVGRDWVFRRGDVAAFTPRPRGWPQDAHTKRADRQAPKKRGGRGKR